MIELFGVDNDIFGTDHRLKLANDVGGNFCKWHESGIFDYFLNLTMKLFFKIKIKQKLLLHAALASTLFLLSCASNKQASVRDGQVDKVISTARSFIGTPYKYGGTSRS